MFKKHDKIDVLHPSIKKMVRPVFTVKDSNGKTHKFYEFKTLHDMSARRFSHLNNFLENRNRGITNEDLKAATTEAIDNIQLDNIKGVTNALIILKYLKARIEIHEDVDIILRIMSCAFFTDKEDLTDYDWDIATWKIDLWEKHGVTSFFLNESVSRFLKSINISATGIQTYINQRQLLKQSLKELNKMGILSESTSGKKNS